MLSVSLIVLLTVLCICQAVPSNQQDKVYIENEITRLNAYLKDSEGTNANLGPYWLQLGLYYQTSDIRWHNGGEYKPLALESFDNALKYPLSSSERITALQRKGLLLKMMSRGNEAVASHAAILDIPQATDRDIAAAYVNMADAKNMIGDVGSALSLLNEALETDPLYLEAYYPLIKTCEEIKCRTKPQEWSVLVSGIERALKEALESEDLIPVSIYWALFEATQKTGNLD
mmetsp:Transcript_2943/g.4463  ORF Transcript_2943/g.4463 Transcript_2943/m.4463 type:complete len:231 (-) Transcript_2943:4091-4783(-)